MLYTIATHSVPHAEEVDLAQHRLPRCGRCGALQKGCLLGWRLGANQELLSAREAVHLRRASSRAFFEGPQDPIAVGFDGRPVAELALEGRLVLRFLPGLYLSLLPALRDCLLQADLFGGKVVFQFLRRGHLFLECELRLLLRLHTILNFVIQILKDHCYNGDDTLRLIFAFAALRELRNWRLVSRDLKLRLLHQRTPFD
mmetsp:Transcript_127124/g.368030  ORF Transcript_127124/g.368030 Transcript_127124/m.368030 type:complete len:200 (-) Transcript_127124:262-861(-)